jgi:hypothetical protein
MGSRNASDGQFTHKILQSIEDGGLKVSDSRSEFLPDVFWKERVGADLTAAVRQVSCTPQLLLWLYGHHMHPADMALLTSRASNGAWLPRLA